MNGRKKYDFIIKPSKGQTLQTETEFQRAGDKKHIKRSRLRLAGKKKGFKGVTDIAVNQCGDFFFPFKIVVDQAEIDVGNIIRKNAELPFIPTL